MNKLDFVAEVVALAGKAGLDAKASARLENEVRCRFGGQRVRIEERAPITLERIDATMRQGKPVAVVAAELGCSRMTIYRHLKKKPQKSQRGA